MPSESEGSPALAAPGKTEGSVSPSSDEQGSFQAPEPGYRVRLPEFEGPLDLLLHLIRVDQIDLFNIPIVEITRQYNETLDLLRELNLEVAGEYLVMAATLLQIKSKMLLPQDPEVLVNPEEDPRKELVRQLEEYERYRLAAGILSQAQAEYSRVWMRPASIVSDYTGEAAVVADLFGLLTAFRRVLETLNRQEQLALRKDRISLLDRIRWVLEKLQQSRRTTFTGLFDGCFTRSELIVTFLALLELIRLQVVGALQAERFGEIDLVLLEGDQPVQIDPARILDA